MPERVSRALQLVVAHFAETRSAPSDRVPFLNRDQDLVYNLQNKDPFFLELLFEPPILEAILKHFLNDPWFRAVPKDDPNYILRAFVARSSRGRLPMHIDSFIPYAGPCVYIMQCAGASPER